MRLIVTDGVVTVISPVKWLNRLRMPFGMWTWVGPGNHVLIGVQIPPCRGVISGGKKRPAVKYRILCRELWRNGWLVVIGIGTWVDPRKHYWMGVHTGATWPIRLNRPCAAAMRPYVKLLWPLVITKTDLLNLTISVAF